MTKKSVRGLSLSVLSLLYVNGQSELHFVHSICSGCIHTMQPECHFDFEMLCRPTVKVQIVNLSTLGVTGALKAQPFRTHDAFCKLVIFILS